MDNTDYLIVGVDRAKHKQVQVLDNISADEMTKYVFICIEDGWTDLYSYRIIARYDVEDWRQTATAEDFLCTYVITGLFNDIESMSMRPDYYTFYSPAKNNLDSLAKSGLLDIKIWQVVRFTY